jgi:hypothetical protein
MWLGVKIDKHILIKMNDFGVWCLLGIVSWRNSAQICIATTSYAENPFKNGHIHSFQSIFTFIAKMM